MFNQPAWQHVTIWVATKSTPPPCAWHFRWIQPQTVLTESLPLHVVLYAPTSSKCSPRRWRSTPRKGVRGSVRHFFWPGSSCRLVHWTTWLEGLCCHLVYLLTSHHVTVWQQISWFALHLKGLHPNATPPSSLKWNSTYLLHLSTQMD